MKNLFEALGDAIYLIANDIAEIINPQKLFEVILWVIAALAVAGRALFAYLIVNSCLRAHSSNEAEVCPNFSAVFQDYYWDILLGLIVLLFPFVFSLVFGALPLYMLRLRLRYGTALAWDSPMGLIVEGREKKEKAGGVKNANTDATTKSSENLLEDNMRASAALASNIYSRSGVYLLIGVLIAFSGLAFFYLRSAQIRTSPDLIDYILKLAPNFGILFL